MFAGKTDELISRLDYAGRRGTAATAVKAAFDGRYEAGDIVSHSGRRWPAVVAESGLAILESAGAFEIVAVDELQFFDDTIVEALLVLRGQGKHVIGAGLDRDFRREPFATVDTLVKKADDVLRLVANCAICSRPAKLTQRVTDGRPASLHEPVLRVGGRELYEPRCEACFEDVRHEVRIVIGVAN
jgi:thymidine kinase